MATSVAGPADAVCYACLACEDAQPCADGARCKCPCSRCGATFGFLHEYEGARCSRAAASDAHWHCVCCGIGEPHAADCVHFGETKSAAERLWCPECGAQPGVECPASCDRRAQTRLFGVNPDFETIAIMIADLQFCAACGDAVCTPTCPHDMRMHVATHPLWYATEANGRDAAVDAFVRATMGVHMGRLIRRRAPDPDHAGGIAPADEIVALGPALARGEVAAFTRAEELYKRQPWG
jgi:hypothetical protein